MRFIKLMLCLCAAFLLVGCTFDHKTPGMTTVQYAPYPTGQFRFEGAHLFWIEEDKLAETIREYKKTHPGEKYEFLSEDKLSSKEQDRIRRIFEECGVELEHFWVPTSRPNPNPGKYGPDYLDVK
ncbi:MAG: hypothetical protein AB1696_19195 [Planctomycetota bacterium]